MGCAPSKVKVCQICRSPYSPVVVKRTKPTRQETGDDLNSITSIPSHDQESAESNQNPTLKIEKVAAAKQEPGLGNPKEIKTRPDDKIPELITPHGEPETINAWELMEGLDEDDTCDAHHHDSSGSVLDKEKKPESAASTNNKVGNAVVSQEKIPDKLTVYFTSLRGVRKTYEDCCHVRVILKGLGVKVDEKDVSLDSRYREELKELLQDKFGYRVDMSGLPRVFLGRKYIGGADEIRRLNEETKLEKMVRNCKRTDDHTICAGCGDVRFVPCDTCSGSCKIYHGEEVEDVNKNAYGFGKCPQCNEYGLRPCPICCH